MRISIKKMRPSCIMPHYASEHAAGMDLSACIDEPLTIHAGETVLIPCGFGLALPVGYEAQIRGRSGMAYKHGIVPAHGVGTIDADYRGEIGAILHNISKQDFVVEPQMRVAQMIIAHHEKADLEEVDVLDETVRGAGGYGSTGLHNKDRS